MKLGVETPDAARRRHAGLAARRDRGAAGRRPADRRGACATADLAAHPRVRERYPVLVAGAARRAPRASCATSPPSAATCCSARAAPYFQDVTKPCNKREPGSRLPGARGRAPQPRDPRPLRALRRHPSRPTWRSRWPRSARSSTSTADGERAIPMPGLHRLPGDEPERDTVLAPGDLITAVELPPLTPRPPAPRYRKVRDRASYAFARRLRRRRARRARRRRRATAGSPSAASPTCRGGRPRPRRRCAARPPTERASPPRPTPSSPRRRAAARQRLQGRRWRATSSSATLAELCGVSDTDRSPRPIGAPLSRVEGRAKVTGAARYAVRAAGRGRRLRRDRRSRRSPAARSRASTRRGARPPRRARGALARERAAAAPRSTTASCASSSRRDVAYRGQIVARGRRRVARGGARGRAALVARRLRRRRARRRAARRPPAASTRPRRSTPASRPTPRTATPTPGSPRRRSCVDATYTTPPIHNNPMEPHATRRASGTAATSTLYDSNQGASASRQRHRRGVRARARAGARDLASTSAAASAPRARRARTSCSPRSPRRSVGRPVKVALTRQQMFALVGYRTPTIQRVRLGADARRPAARDRATTSFEQTSTVQEFAEQTAIATRHDVRGARPAHHAPARRARRADAVVDARAGRVPGHVRARVGDGRARGRAAGIDPIELRIAQRARARPREGHRRSARATSSPACARARERFGWARPRPGARRAPRRPLADRHRRRRLDLPGLPLRRRRRPRALDADGDFIVRHRRRRHRHRRAHGAHPDRRRRARRRPVEQVRVEIGDSAFAAARVAGGSMGTASWGTAVVKACRALRDARPTSGEVPADGARRPPTRPKALRRALLAPRVRRPVRRGARRRRHRRGPRPAHARRLRASAASSTRRPPARSSSAA